MGCVKGRAFTSPGGGKRLAAAAAAVLGGFAVAACSGIPGISEFGATTLHGYVVSPMALEQIPVGSSRDQVLIALGTPSTTATAGGEAFYYISQTRSRPVKFMQPRIVDQRVVAVYFDADSKVARVANYGLQDGKLFDFITRTTPTSGADLNFVQQLIRGGAAPGIGSVLGGSS
jgi:outer membrane protein assembly factor BamE (lipoprotein component of BamABCDE complex)